MVFHESTRIDGRTQVPTVVRLFREVLENRFTNSDGEGCPGSKTRLYRKSEDSGDSVTGFRKRSFGSDRAESPSSWSKSGLPRPTGLEERDSEEFICESSGFGSMFNSCVQMLRIKMLEVLSTTRADSKVSLSQRGPM